MYFRPVQSVLSEEYCAGDREISRPKKNPIRKASPSRLLEVGELFNAIGQFLVVVAESATQYLLKRDLTILSLAMGPGAVIACDTSLNPDECDVALNQITTSSDAAVDRPEFW